jgi:hypothetical protein
LFVGGLVRVQNGWPAKPSKDLFDHFLHGPGIGRSRHGYGLIDQT